MRNIKKGMKFRSGPALKGTVMRVYYERFHPTMNTGKRKKYFSVRWNTDSTEYSGFTGTDLKRFDFKIDEYNQDFERLLK